MLPRPSTLILLVFPMLFVPFSLYDIILWDVPTETLPTTRTFAGVALVDMTIVRIRKGMSW